jgi:hypothetical protein
MKAPTAEPTYGTLGEMPPQDEARLRLLLELVKGRVLFPKKIESAKKALNAIKASQTRLFT